MSGQQPLSIRPLPFSPFPYPFSLSLSFLSSIEQPAGAGEGAQQVPGQGPVLTEGSRPVLMAIILAVRTSTERSPAGDGELALGPRDWRLRGRIDFFRGRDPPRVGLML